MKHATTLHAQRVDYGRSEIWLEADGRELTPRRRLATNEVINVTRRHCTPEVFQPFYSDPQAAVGPVATLDVSNLDKVVMEFRLEV